MVDVYGKLVGKYTVSPMDASWVLIPISCVPKTTIDVVPGSEVLVGINETFIPAETSKLTWSSVEARRHFLRMQMGFVRMTL